MARTAPSTSISTAAAWLAWYSLAVLPQRILDRLLGGAAADSVSSAVRTTNTRSVIDFGNVSTSFFISSKAQSR